MSLRVDDVVEALMSRREIKSHHPRVEGEPTAAFMHFTLGRSKAVLQVANLYSKTVWTLTARTEGKTELLDEGEVKSMSDVAKIVRAFSAFADQDHSLFGLSGRVADRWLKKSRAERWMGINVSSFDERYRDQSYFESEWMDDMLKLVKEYWSLHKVSTGIPSQNYMWAQVQGAMSGPIQIDFLGNPSSRMKVRVVSTDLDRGGVLDEKTFGSGSSLKEIMLWIDKVDRNAARW